MKARTMDIIRRIFSGVSNEYLFKSYVISAIITALLCISAMESIHDIWGILTLGMVFILFLLFPFSAIVWDDFITTMMGGNIIFLPVPIMLIWKFFKIVILYFFSWLVGPIGILYVLYRTRK